MLEFILHLLTLLLPPHLLQCLPASTLHHLHANNVTETAPCLNCLPTRLQCHASPVCALHSLTVLSPLPKKQTSKYLVWAVGVWRTDKEVHHHPHVGLICRQPRARRQDKVRDSYEAAADVEHVGCKGHKGADKALRPQRHEARGLGHLQTCVVVEAIEYLMCGMRRKVQTNSISS